jgi:hypothetical protein
MDVYPKRETFTFTIRITGSDHEHGDDDGPLKAV